MSGGAICTVCDAPWLESCAGHPVLPPYVRPAPRPAPTPRVRAPRPGLAGALERNPGIAERYGLRVGAR